MFIFLLSFLSKQYDKDLSQQCFMKIAFGAVSLFCADLSNLGIVKLPLIYFCFPLHREMWSAPEHENMSDYLSLKGTVNH